MTDFTNWNVLVVDDEPHNVKVVRHVLEFHGAQVQACASGTECLEIVVSAQMPDFILLDIQMPGMNGYEVLEAIRRLPTTKDLVVIALTALAMPGDYEKGMSAGFDGYITKPIRVDQLPSQIMAIIEGKANVS